LDERAPRYLRPIRSENEAKTADPSAWLSPSCDAANFVWLSEWGSVQSYSWNEYKLDTLWGVNGRLQRSSGAMAFSIVHDVEICAQPPRQQSRPTEGREIAVIDVTDGQKQSLNVY
jgi:hypothetical protein